MGTDHLAPQSTQPRRGTDQIAPCTNPPCQAPNQIAPREIVVTANNTCVAPVWACTGSRWPRFGAQDRFVRCRILPIARRCAGSSGCFGLTRDFLRAETRNLLESLTFFCVLRNRVSIKPWGKPSMTARNHTPLRLQNIQIVQESTPLCTRFHLH